MDETKTEECFPDMPLPDPEPEDFVFGGADGPRFSEDNDLIVKALFEFHKACSGVVGKDGVNPFYNSSYTTRAAIKKAIGEPLVKAGLFPIHDTRPIGFPEVKQLDRDTREWVEGIAARTEVITYLIHAKSGQWVRTSVVMDGKDSGPHALGSLLTYGARYNLGSLCDLAPEDDDGNTAAPAAPARRRTAGQRAQDGGKKDAKPVSPELAAASEQFWKDIVGLVQGDHGDAVALLREVTSFGKFKGYDDFRKIKNDHMLISSKERLEAHQTFGDDYTELVAIRQDQGGDSDEAS